MAVATRQFAPIYDLLIFDNFHWLAATHERRWPRLEAVQVIRDRDWLIVTEGFARVEALKSSGPASVLADVTPGTVTDALLAAIKIFLRKSQTQVAVGKALAIAREHPAWSEMPPAELSRVTGLPMLSLAYRPIAEEAPPVITTPVAHVTGRVRKKRDQKRDHDAAVDALERYASRSLREIARLTKIQHKKLSIIQRELGVVPIRQRLAEEARQAVTNPEWQLLSDRKLSALTGVTARRIATQRELLRQANEIAR